MKAPFASGSIAGLLFLSALAPALSQTPPPSPYRLADGENIKLNGVVTKAESKTFELDYGPGAITVELDDYDTYEEGFNIVVGDKVNVDGRIDADPGKERTIEARSVFIPAIDLRIDANPIDEEDTETKFFNEPLKDGTEVELRGIIKAIDGETVTIQSSKGRVEVHFDRLEKKQRITLRLGQAIKITGIYENRLIRKDKLFAQTVEPLREQ